MKATSLTMLILAASAAAVSGYPLFSSNKRYSTWLPFRAHPLTPYLDPYGPPTQEDFVDFYYPSPEPLHYYPPAYYYGLPEYYYETGEEEDEQPEQWYGGNNGETNALFLRNLMLAQLYNRAQKEPTGIAYGGEMNYWPTRTRDIAETSGDDQMSADGDSYVYGEPIKSSNPISKEDRDVRELKSLVENRWVDKREDERLITRKPIRQEHKPSAYDAIKKLLIQQEKKDNDVRQPHKRSYIPNEDSLVEQLGSLKKI